VISPSSVATLVFAEVMSMASMPEPSSSVVNWVTVDGVILGSSGGFPSGVISSEELPSVSRIGTSSYKGGVVSVAVIVLRDVVSASVECGFCGTFVEIPIVGGVVVAAGLLTSKGPLTSKEPLVAAGLESCGDKEPSPVLNESSVASDLEDSLDSVATEDDGELYSDESSVMATKRVKF
jgi:hypothetical protein